MSTDTRSGYYAPPLPTRQIFSPWVRDANGVMSREVFAVEIEDITPRAELARLRIRLAGSESVKALRSVQDAATALAEHADEDVREDVIGLLARCAAKLLRAKAP
jgi:hypothetical protein